LGQRGSKKSHALVVTVETTEQYYSDKTVRAVATKVRVKQNAGGAPRKQRLRTATYWVLKPLGGFTWGLRSVQGLKKKGQEERKSGMQPKAH